MLDQDFFLKPTFLVGLSDLTGKRPWLLSALDEQRKVGPSTVTLSEIY
jgi:hypothetical protein